MKRKFKLLATVASLCLSVALMAFGVYAASQSTYNVTSSVTYESQVAVTWNGTVAGGASGGVDDTENKVEYAADADAAAIEHNFENVVLGTGEGENVVTYTITCKNDSTGLIDVTVSEVAKFFSEIAHSNGGDTKGFAVSVTSTGTPAAQATLAADYVVAENLAPTQTATLTIVVTLNDYTLDIAQNAQAMDITLLAKAAA